MKSIIVTGSDRSGTSLTASLLHKAGVNMGRKLVGESVSNPKGHYENEAFFTLNNEILVAAGGSWRELPKVDAIYKVAPQFVEKIREVLKNEASELWGAKDPRFCITYELYLPHLQNPHFVICKRNPDAIVRSLARRRRIDSWHKDLEIAKPEEFVAEHYRRIEPVVSHYPTFYCQFEELIANPKKQIATLFSFLGMSVDIEDLAAVVDPSLDHSTENLATALSDED